VRGEPRPTTGGNAAECATDPVGHWGATTDVYYPEMTEEQACVPALMNAGFDPADVKFILQSHLLLDHTGAVAAPSDFPNAQVVATRVEYEYAHAPDWFAAAATSRRTATRPTSRGSCSSRPTTATTSTATA
jgi:N-acyl homoserine lactone hydrolase